MSHRRKYTKHLLLLVDEGVIDCKEALLFALLYMSEEDVRTMMCMHQLVEEKNDGQTQDVL